MLLQHVREIGLLSLGGVILLFALQEGVEAQTRGGSPKQSTRQQFQKSWQNRPTVSPYLSLVGSNGGTATGGSDLNYYNIVRPRAQSQKTVQNFTHELNSLERNYQKTQDKGTSPLASDAPISTGRMPETGHQATFGDLRSYYPSPSRSR